MVNYEELFMKHLDAQGVKYSHIGESGLKITFTGRNMRSVSVLALFDQEGKPIVHLRCVDICNIRMNEPFGLRVCNEANRSYHWVKFYLDEDGDIISGLDAYLEESTCGPVCLELVKKLAKTTDEAYRIFTAEIWE